jgi:porin
MLAEDSHGMGLTEDFVGDVQWLDNMDPGAPFAQVTEYWWQRELCDERLTVRLGKQDPNAEFAVVDLGGDFVNSSFGIHSNLPMPTWPNTAMGVTTLADLTDSVALKCGVFDGEAEVGDWGVSGTGTTFSIFECETQWNFDDGRLPGDFHIGLWYHSGQWSNLQNDDLTHTGNHGAYLGLEQMLCKESDDSEDPQGLGIFFQYSQTPEDLNEVSHYYGSGLVYQGLIPGRDQDVTGVAAGQAIFSTYLDRPLETAVELFHKIQWSPHLVVEPDLQYIANPSGLYQDAFVFGVRFEAVL